jgi:hypothetical protein
MMKEQVLLLCPSARLEQILVPANLYPFEIWDESNGCEVIGVGETEEEAWQDAHRTLTRR